MPYNNATMRIETFIICCNEQKLIHYIMRHYSAFSQVTILDTGCTDRTVEIAQSYGARIERVHSDGMNDFHNRYLKNSCWKGSTADWVITVDADEFVVPDLELMETTYANIITTDWYEMYSEVFPTTQGQIYDEVTLGHLGRTKLNVFRPTLKETNFDTGCHKSNPIGELVYVKGMKTLHFRHLGLEYILERNARTRQNMSRENIERGLSIHFNYTEEKVREEFYEGINKARYETLHQGSCV